MPESSAAKSPAAGRWPAMLLILLGGCGYVRAPLTPLANVPASITNLAAVERGSIIIVHFPAPTVTTEGNDVKGPLQFDLRIGTEGTPFRADDWAAHATNVNVTIQQGLPTAEIPIANWVGKEAIIGVRVTGANKKESGWSNYQVLRVVAPVPAPTDFKLENVEVGVRTSWSGPGDRFRIMKRTGPKEPWIEGVNVAGHEWSDNTTEYGNAYTYEVQALVDVGGGKFAESDFSPAESIVPKDVFPPAVPTGVNASAAVTTIEVVWNRNTEPDFAHYFVYRSVDNGSFQKVAESDVPSYSDQAVQRGKVYRYEISAVDKVGNESIHSTPSQASLQ